MKWTHAVAASAFLTNAALGVQSSIQEVGNVRITAISDSLVRIEAKGPKGWENRPTFHVAARPKAQSTLERTEDAGMVQLDGRFFRILIPEGASSPVGVKVLSKRGTVLYEVSGQETNSVWLPEPSDKPQAWAFADKPRLVLQPNRPPQQFGYEFDTANDAFDVYVFLPRGNTERLRREFLTLTGPTEMPPLYLFGYIHSRYHPYSDKQALELIDKYQAHGFPLDVFVVDTDWRVGASHGYDSNTKLFPDMPAFLEAAENRGTKIMFNDHPEPKSKGAFDQAELTYRFDGLSRWLKAGVDVWWYDRNWHIGLVEPLPGLRKEVWGMQLYRDIAEYVHPKLRPAIMANIDGIDNGRRNRPPNVAAHRYPIQWTGDTLSTWQFLQFGIENAVHQGAAALNPYVSEDLAGHVGNPSPRYYTRFMQYGALSPTMRLHHTAGMKDREPWVYGSEVEGIVRDYTKLRYRLLPHFYALARQNFETGLPLVARGDFYFPKHTEAKRNDQYFLGPDLLVAPIYQGDDPKPVAADWLKTDSGKPGLEGEYFDNPELLGKPKLKRIDPLVNFNWGQNGPLPGGVTDQFSARWSGKITIPAGVTGNLGLRGDDGVRLYLDGKLMVDKWVAQDSVTTMIAEDLVPGRTYSLRIEFMELSGHAVCQLVFREKQKSLDESREVWIPEGTWVSIWDGAKFEGPRLIQTTSSLEQIPIFVRQGSVMLLAAEPERNTTLTNIFSHILVEVIPSSRAKATLYEDDSNSIAYKSKGYRKTTFESRSDAFSEVVEWAAARGSFESQLSHRDYSVRVRVRKEPREVLFDGVAVPFKFTRKSKAGPILDPRTAARDEDSVLLDLKRVANNRSHKLIVRY